MLCRKSRLRPVTVKLNRLLLPIGATGPGGCKRLHHRGFFMNKTDCKNGQREQAQHTNGVSVLALGWAQRYNNAATLLANGLAGRCQPAECGASSGVTLTGWYVRARIGATGQGTAWRASELCLVARELARWIAALAGRVGWSGVVGRSLKPVDTF